MAFKMKPFSGFKKKTDEDKFPTRPLEPGEGKPKGGIAPIPGVSSKVLKTFEKIAKSRALQNKQMQKMLEKSGKIFVKKKKK